MTNGRVPKLQLILVAYDRFLRVVLTGLLGLMILPVSLQILSRYTGLIPRYIWTEEAARFCFVWLIMVGSIIAVREGTHFDVDLLPQPRTNRGKAVTRLVVDVIMLFMAVVFAWHGVAFAQFGFVQSSEMSGINMLSIHIAFPLAGASWALFLLERIVKNVWLWATPDRGAAS